MSAFARTNIIAPKGRNRFSMEERGEGNAEPPVCFSAGVARVTGLEPATFGVTGRHSNQLSYTRIPLSRLRKRVRRREVGLVCGGGAAVKRDIAKPVSNFWFYVFVATDFHVRRLACVFSPQCPRKTSIAAENFKISYRKGLKRRTNWSNSRSIESAATVNVRVFAQPRGHC